MYSGKGKVKFKKNNFPLSANPLLLDLPASDNRPDDRNKKQRQTQPGIKAAGIAMQQNQRQNGAYHH
jgi:hypothetical protein